MINAHLAAELLVEGERMPVFVWTIDHPAGLVLVDTGMIDSTPSKPVSSSIALSGQMRRPRGVSSSVVVYRIAFIKRRLAPPAYSVFNPRPVATTAML